MKRQKRRVRLKRYSQRQQRFAVQSLGLTILSRKSLRDLLLSREGRGDAGICPSHRLGHLIKQALLYGKLNPSVADSHFKRGTALEGKRGADKVSGWFLHMFAIPHATVPRMIWSKTYTGPRQGANAPSAEGPSDRSCCLLFLPETNFVYLERVRTQERCDKISGLYPSCGLTTEPHLSKPLWALLQGVSNILTDTSSPTLSHPPRRPRGTSIRLSAYASLLCGDWPSAFCRLGRFLPSPLHTSMFLLYRG